MSQKIRIGNDINITWSVLKKDKTPYPINSEVLDVYMVVNHCKVDVDSVTVSGNTISFTFFGRDQMRTGSYALVLVENKGNENMITHDVKDAFTLVPHSWQEEYDDEPVNVHVESVLNNNIVVPDEETITSTDHTGIISLKNREYNEEEPNGLGYVILSPDKSFISQITSKNTIYEIRHEFDLDGSEVTIPQDCKLVFNGGKISDGTLVGDNTRIDANGSDIFDGITISGDWSVPEIHSNWFSDIHQENCLLNLISLSNDDFNHIIIKEGTYSLSQSEGGSWSGILFVKSNTWLTINGNLVLEPNSLEVGRMIHCLDVSNVLIDGSGTLVGDKDTHTGSTGESFHGIMISNSSDVIVRGLDVSSFWGDCVCIGGSRNGDDLVNKRIILENLTLHDSRRQGISIIHADGVEVKNCQIYGISGTAPQAGIDIEPNSNGYCHNIVISGCDISQCTGAGILTYAPSNGKIKNVSVFSSSISQTSGGSVSIANAENVSVDSISAAGTVFVNSGECVTISNSKINLPGTTTNASLLKNVRFEHCIFTMSATSTSVYGYVDGCMFRTDTSSNFNVQLYGGGRNLSFSEIPTVHLRGSGKVYENISISTSKRFSNETYPVTMTGCKVIDIDLSTNYSTAPYGFFQSSGANINEMTISVAENSSIPTCIGYIQTTGGVTSVTGIHYSFAFSNTMFLGSGASDMIKKTTGVLTSGSTSSRPSSPFVGTQYYDSTLNKPIWYKGSSVWVDATGTTV